MSGTPLAKGVGENRSVLARMFHLDAAGGEFVGHHRPEQFGPRRRERMRRLVAQRLFHVWRRQRDTVLLDEAAEALPVTFGAQRAGQQRQVDAAPGLLPSAERAGGDVLPHALFRAAKESEFPIVNRAGAVGGKVRDRPRSTSVFTMRSAPFLTRCAPYMRMTLALRLRAAAICPAQSPMTAAMSAEQAGGGWSGSTRMFSSWLRLSRPASGRTLTFLRLRGGGTFFIRQRRVSPAGQTKRRVA